MRKLVICWFVLCTVVIEVYSQGCSLTVDMFDDQHKPVLVDNSTSKYRLVFPQNGNIDLKTGGRINFLCPNPRNTLTITHTNLTQATCLYGTTVRIIQNTEDVGSITCKNGVRGEAISTSIRCGGGQGYIIRLGFTVSSSDFLTLIEVCYNGRRGTALYSNHQLIGKEIAYSSKSSYRPSFSTAQLAPGVAANLAFKQVYEKSNFNRLLGSAKLAEKYINSKSFLARGHLSPDADFLFASWQIATFFYVNVAPQWQAINNGNWKRLESLSRNTAKSYNDTLEVYTGIHEVLQLMNAEDIETDMYMTSDGKLPIPKFIWKILYLQTSKKAISFISLNNPFASSLDNSDMLCKNVCNRYGWDNPAWTNGSKGFVYCCDARDLLKVVPTGPKITIRGILEAPERVMKFADYE
ncbi:hypothetical protein HHI36_016354 [Cryptolaemus montrouzieri]|uniref:DNA/RNA non-specific endonuclease/pyrophosphatase/phosphodiesterase domain-containing protein n=1 Tax=Cryptolaemus montrouzieri TaxID=559131 RepID=A0ABD2NJY8_9CUCU